MRSPIEWLRWKLQGDPPWGYRPAGPRPEHWDPPSPECREVQCARCQELEEYAALLEEVVDIVAKGSGELVEHERVEGLILVKRSYALFLDALERAATLREKVRPRSSDRSEA